MKNKVELIGEIAQAHEGSLGLAHSYIDALAEAGVDTVKFQMHIAEAESSLDEKFRVNFSYEDKTRFDYWKRMSFTFEQWAGLKSHCDEKKLEFLCSPFSIQSVEWLEQLNIERYKIASGEISNYLMLEKICKTSKPILLSSGMSSFKELDDCKDFIISHKGKLEAIFQCTTQYPTLPENYGLNVINEIKNTYNVKVGLSDHSGEIFAALAATALGADMLELHVVYDKNMFGPDSGSSITVSDFKKLRQGVDKIKCSLNNPVNKNNTDNFKELKVMFGKSLAVNKNIKIGHMITIDDLETKKPGGKGIDAINYREIIGKRAKKEIIINSFVQQDDLE